jgi:CDP-diacylglycerol--glycerol-3-phosphate 3-phosphatidyltransferase
MNFPNTLSVLRIILSPVFLVLFLSGSPALVTVSFFVFTIAALTDWYDGWYARKYGFKTRWGQFLDPLADKILTSCAFLGFYIMDNNDPSFFGASNFIPVWILVAIIILRDIILTAVRSYKEIKGQEFRTSYISKAKTFVQMTYIFAVIGFVSIGMLFRGTEINSIVYGFLYSELNYYILLFITLLTVASAVAYIFESRTEAGSKLAQN